MYPKKYPTSYWFVKQGTSEVSGRYQIGARLRPLWNHSEPSEGPYYTYQLLAGYFFGFTQCDKAALVNNMCVETPGLSLFFLIISNPESY